MENNDREDFEFSLFGASFLLYIYIYSSFHLVREECRNYFFSESSLLRSINRHRGLCTRTMLPLGTEFDEIYLSDISTLVPVPSRNFPFCFKNFIQSFHKITHREKKDEKIVLELLKF